MTHKRVAPAAYNAPAMPGGLFMTSPNSTAEQHARAADKPVPAKLPLGGLDGGDWSSSSSAKTPQMAQATQMPQMAQTTQVAQRPQMAPAVAQLFSSVSATRRPVHDEVLELLDVHPQGIELTHFCHAFETCFRRPFDSRWSDVGDLRQMLDGMLDLVECVERGSEVIVRRKFGTDYFQGNASQF